MPIRWRLTLFIALVIGAILLLLGLALFFLIRDELLSSVEDTVRSRASTAAQTINAGENLSDEDVQQLTLDGVFVILRDASGTILDQTLNLPINGEADDPAWRRALDSGEAIPGTIDISEEAHIYVYAVPVDTPNGPELVVEAGKSYESTEETIEVVQTILITGIGVAFLLSIGGAYVLAGAALKPVDDVVSAAQEMSASDLAKRLPVANPKDEVGRLATTINGLLSRLEAAFTRREEALMRQRRFAANASHELRTPLTSISGHARMLDEWALDQDPNMAKRSVGAIRREAKRMRNLIESLLALSRGDEGAPMEIGRYDLAVIVEEAVQIVWASTDGKVSVEYVPPEHEIAATFDRDRVLQVASILLDNAVKYTQEGGSIVVRVGEDDGWAILEVFDTGTGIPEDALPLIFERFHRVDPARTEGGAGLGLSIARQIAESHGGRIEAKSTPGEGSAFTLFLPRKGPRAFDKTRMEGSESPGGTR